MSALDAWQEAGTYGLEQVGESLNSASQGGRHGVGVG